MQHQPLGCGHQLVAAFFLRALPRGAWEGPKPSLGATTTTTGGNSFLGQRSLPPRGAHREVLWRSPSQAPAQLGPGDRGLIPAPERKVVTAPASFSVLNVSPGPGTVSGHRSYGIPEDVARTGQACWPLSQVPWPPSKPRSSDLDLPQESRKSSWPRGVLACPRRRRVSASSSEPEGLPKARPQWTPILLPGQLILGKVGPRALGPGRRQMGNAWAMFPSS